jgi:hypothetical protein
MVPASLGRELAPFLDEGPELRLAAFELATLVIERYPVGYLIFGLLFDFIISFYALCPSSRELARGTTYHCSGCRQKCSSSTY